MRNGGDILANTLRSYTNLKILELEESEITDEHLVPIVEAIRDHRIPIEEFSLHSNNIGDATWEKYGNAGCEAIATLLEHSNCKLNCLVLSDNNISDGGINVIANSLLRNSQLREIYLGANPFDF